VRPELLRFAVELSASRRVPLALHLAESREEIELLRSGSGPFREMLSQIEGWSPDAIPRNSRPMDYLRLLARADRAMIVHGNYLEDDELAFVAERAERMSLVYCPRTHAFFAHRPYPLAKMQSLGLAVALGTDSRASSPSLSILEEMRFLASRASGVSPATILAMATLHGAKALGRETECGSIAPGKSADLTIVALPNRSSRDPYELLFGSDLPVVGRWLRGHA
jgi:cytosine/adenosine deaminase-related metal-dependent hydrolase